MRKFKSKNLVIAIIALIVIVKVFSVLIDIEGAAKPLTIIDGNFHVTINGKVVEFNDVYGYPKLIKETERTLVPLRIISEQMGYLVDWDQSTRTAIIKGGSSTVQIAIGENTALVNGKKVAIDTDKDGNALSTKSMLLKVAGDINPRTYVPIRFISETTGADIQYKNVNGVHHITITTEGNVVPPIETGKITFDPAKDVTSDGRITEAKSIEYLEEALKNVKIVNEGGKYYFKYDAIALPDYGEVVVGIGLNTSTGLGLSTAPMLEKNRIPSNQSFKMELEQGKINKNMERVTISLTLLNRQSTNKTHPTTARIEYGYYGPTNSSDYFIFNQYNTVIHEKNINKSIIFGNLFN